MGHPEKSPFHELRQNVQGSKILLQGEHLEEGAGRKALLPVSVLSKLLVGNQKL
nr:unnamed protein product [Callosobruchus chinensis]